MNNNLFYDPKAENYLIEYRGDFKKEIEDISYIAGAVLNETMGIIALKPEDIPRLLKDVPSIVYIDVRNINVLLDTTPVYVDNINNVKINPYLGLTGKGVVVGIIDTGIDYLNEEFMREDGTSRIISIWDQSIRNEKNENLYIGQVYNNEQINKAINEFKSGKDPYAIVPSKDEIGHGTNVAGVIGARGYNENVKGVAEQCEFLIVKLFESSNFKANLKENNINDVPVYNTSEIVAAVEYLKEYFYKLNNKPMVIFIGVGTTEGSHDGTNLISRYINSIGLIRGICLVTGVGNEGDAQGHVFGYINNTGESSTQEISIPREMKNFKINIWVKRPNIFSINILSPTGEASNLIKAKLNKIQKNKFIFTDTEFTVSFRTPDNFTGHQVIEVNFSNIKPGLWKLQLIGEYVIEGRYDIWLPPKRVLPENLVFLSPNPYTTLTIPGTAKNVITAAYYGENKIILADSGKGFTLDYEYNSGIKPDISTIGINIITTKALGGETLFSGSSAASAITAGGCALLLEWGIIKGNDKKMYSRKIRSYLIYGANRSTVYKYPNEESGYGEFNLLGTFNVIAKIYERFISSDNFNDDYEEYYINNLFLRVSKNSIGDFEWRKMI